MKPILFLTDPRWHETVIEHPGMDEIESVVPYRLGSRPPSWVNNPRTFFPDVVWTRQIEFKNCPVPHNIMTKSIVIPAPCDILYGMENGEFKIHPEWEDFYIDSHPEHQLNGYAPGYTNIKFVFPFFIETPKKMNMWVTPAFLHNHHFDAPFEPMFGLINVNRKMHCIVNTLIRNDRVREGHFDVLKCGEPLAYLIFPDYPGKVKFEIKKLEYTPIQRFFHRAGKYFRID